MDNVKRLQNDYNFPS